MRNGSHNTPTGQRVGSFTIACTSEEEKARVMSQVGHVLMLSGFNVALVDLFVYVVAIFLD